MSTIILFSLTFYIYLSGMYNSFPLLPTMYFFHNLQAPQCILALSLEKGPSFIPHGSVSFVILLGLGCRSFPLILVIEHGSTKRCPKTSPAREI